MNFDLQRFDTESGPKWIRDGVSHPMSMSTYANAWCFIPAGKTYTATSTSYYDNAWEMTMQYFTHSPDGNETIRIAKADGSNIKWGFGDDGIEGQTTTAVTYTGGVPASEIVVTGSDRSLLRLTIDGVEYMADDDGKLVLASVPIAAGAWYALYSERTTYGWLAAASTTQNEGYLDDGDTNVTIWATNLSAISGNATAATAVLASGKAVGNVTVTGAAADALTLTIGGTAYYVNALGGLSADWLTKAEAANTYLGKSDTAARATTADTLTTRRVLYISDRTSANTGPGVYFSGGANITIKMPAAAEFEQLTATNLVLGTTASTVEGAMWLEWS